MAKLTTKQWVEKAKKVHGDKPYYDEAIYAGANNPIDLVCPEHGTFTTRADTHLRGHFGCKECAKASQKKAVTKDTNWFVEKAQKLYGNVHTYEKTKYTKWDEEVIITCKIHGDFTIEANNYLRKFSKGCQKCSREHQASILSNGQEGFIERSTKIHEGKYTYDKVVYKGVHTHVTITCPIHGDFPQTPSNHMNEAHGCHTCGVGIISDNDAVYIWKVVGYDNVYKIGLTSFRTGDKRIRSTASNNSVKYDTQILKQVNDALSIEKELLKLGTFCDLFLGKDGGTEFRYLSHKELKKALSMIEVL